jgi:Rieske Fe-S protein
MIEETDPHSERCSAAIPAGQSRRAVLALGAGAAVAALGACSVYDQRGGDATTAPAPTGPIAQTADVPVGGGVVLDGRGLVLTQPQAGTFKAFSAICTHQGCTVAAVSGGTINCPCHGSQFSIVDGSVASGPARRPLPEKAIAVSGTDINLA